MVIQTTYRKMEKAMKRKIRIVERTHPDGKKSFVIQRKDFFIGWQDCWVLDGKRNDTFSTLKEAKKNLCWFDGTKYKDKPVPFE